MSKIILKNLKFSNMFSYGKNPNIIDFDKNRITQLTAPNGSGKSSIALILQEILFNKNIKGIKKADIINRWSKSKTWWAELEFEVDREDFWIAVERTGAKSTVKFAQQFNSDILDMSEHKILDTYKSIQELLNLNFEIFSQLTYQSSVDLLEFLKATDTNRKKFLINLFNLEKYIKIGEALKIKTNNYEKELASLQGELKTIDSFLENTEISDKKKFINVPEINHEMVKKLGVLETNLEEYEYTCKKIDKNNFCIKERDSIKFDLALKKPETKDYLYDAVEEFNNDLIKLKIHKENLEKSLIDLDTSDTCYACGQSIDNTKTIELHSGLNTDLCETIYKIEATIEELKYAKDIVEIHNNELSNYLTNQENIKEFERLIQTIDETLSLEYPNYDKLIENVRMTRTLCATDAGTTQEAIDHNQEVGIHNAKVEALIEQKVDFSSRQNSVKNDTITLSNKLNNLNILRKAFSTSGIVAFKLENLTKELENTINHYLSLLSDGQFQVSFKLDKEKLNIIVSNNGIDTAIETVSGGEFSRIQTAILLAIRTLLSKLGGSSVNLLFLDEITGVLDDEGKEKLIEVLSEEEDLNVFLISHDFTHPLINKISITKENNISSIQQ